MRTIIILREKKQNILESSLINNKINFFFQKKKLQQFQNCLRLLQFSAVNTSKNTYYEQELLSKTRPQTINLIQIYKYNTQFSKQYLELPRKIEMSMQVQKTAEQWKQEGNDYFKNKNYRQAVEAYSEAIRLNPNEPTYFSNRAICYLNLKNYLKTIDDCNKALTLDPNSSKAHRRRGLALMNTLNFEDAVSSFKRAYAIDKDNSIRAEMEDCQSLDKNYKKYFQCFELNDFAQALRCVNYILSKLPQNDKLLLMRIESLAKTGSTDEAQVSFKALSNEVSNGPDGWYLRGLIELYGGDSARAKKFFTEGMRQDPDNNKCRLALNRAKKCETLKEKGNELIKEQKYEEAAEQYSEALNLDPANKKLNAVIYSNRGLCFMKKKEWNKALDDMNRSLELDSNYTKALIRRAEIQMERKEYTAAIMDYSKIQELDPSADMNHKIKHARKLERESKKKDYYADLGLQKGASDADIKKAYKVMAMKYHPDKNRTKSEAEQAEAAKKFKEIAEAYGVLSDAKKKQLYDSGQMEYDGDDGGMGGGFHGGNVDPNEIFKMFFGGGGGGFGGGGFGAGGDDFSQFFGSSGGRGGGNQKFTFRFG